RKDLVCLDRIVFVQLHSQQLAAHWIHRGGVEFFCIHLAQALETLYLNTTPANLLDGLQDFGDGKERSDYRPFAFPFDQLKNRLVAGGIMIDLQATLGEFRKYLYYGVRLVEFNSPGSASKVGRYRSVAIVTGVPCCVAILTSCIIVIKVQIAVQCRELL